MLLFKDNKHNIPRQLTKCKQLIACGGSCCGNLLWHLLWQLLGLVWPATGKDVRAVHSR